MKPLPPPDSFHLKAAEGWLELGNAVEARAELEQMGRTSKKHPDVLELRWKIHAAAREWTDSIAVAAEMAQRQPECALGWIHWAYSLHELKRTQEAWDVLLPVAGRFPDEFLIRYNLACYACQLGQRDEARRWLKAAIKLIGVKPILNMAAEDLDLKPMWNELGGLKKQPPAE